MANEILMVGPHLAPIIGHLEPEILVHRYWEATDSAKLLREIGPRVRAIATDAFTGASAELMRGLPNLQLIANFGVGYDTVDLEFARTRGIAITNTPEVLNDDVADLALALMLAVSRRLPQADRFVRTGRWHNAAFPLTRKLTGKRLGILGLGRIGKAVAKRARAFDMDIGYHGRNAQPAQPFHYFDSLLELATWADFLVVLIPDTQATRGLVDRQVLAGLGTKGILINVARGAIVDEAALVEALETNALGGAGLDVFTLEPHVPEGLLALDNVVLQPHVGSATTDTRQAMAMLVVGNLRAFFRGEPLLTPAA